MLLSESFSPFTFGAPSTPAFFLTLHDQGPSMEFRSFRVQSEDFCFTFSSQFYLYPVVKHQLLIIFLGSMDTRLSNPIALNPGLVHFFLMICLLAVELSISSVRVYTCSTLHFSLFT